MSKNINIPKLRFKEFTKEWEEKKLSDIAIFSKGKGISKSDIVENGNLECIRYGELYTRYKEIIKTIYSKTNLDKKDLILSEYGDVIIPSSGETQIDIATASCVLKDNVALGGDLNIIKTKEDGIFLSYYLNSKKKLDIAKLSQGISVVHLYSSQLRLLIINIPQKEEQERIALFLSSVDTKIEQLIKKDELLQQYKKSIMQKTFSQKIRFKDNDGNEFKKWEERKLKNLCDVIKGEQLNRDNLTEIGDYPAINGGINPSGFTDKYNTLSDTITISEGGNSCGYINFIKTNFWSGGHNYSLQNLKENIENIYLFQYLKYNENLIMNLRVGSGLPNIQKSDIVNFRILLPCVEEQYEIANFLSSIDDKIEENQKILEKIKELKKSLLQQMFI
ncbi:hypothetical protein CRU92_03475 [Arcobacter sp. FW59]|nr:hypothetical protein CRU92_03475 [Arcobacter sp. FW59]